MTGTSNLLDNNKKTISVAINSHFDQFLSVAACFTLYPVFLTGARPVCHIF